MIYGKITSSEGALVSFSIFEGTAADEYHLMITPSAGTSADVQYRQIGQAVEEFLVSRRLVCPTVIYHRYFSSDVANHAAILPLQERNLENVISLVQQPPALGNKILAWVYLASFHQSTPQTRSDSRSFTVSHNGYDHIYTSGMVAPQQKGSLEQTNAIFGEYASLLMREGLSLAGHCIRTWIFVRDIDNNYGGMVKARNAFFQKEGLTSATRFIASTGIEGKTAQPGALVAMDAYAIGGIAPAQISHLKGLSHLSPTHVYGVAFERGTTVDYGDRRHIFISGTASIDHRGHILHQGDITRQTGRTFTNIRVLLEEAGASFRDVSSPVPYPTILPASPIAYNARRTSALLLLLLRCMQCASTVLPCVVPPCNCCEQLRSMLHLLAFCMHLTCPARLHVSALHTCSQLPATQRQRACWLLCWHG